MGPWPLFLDRTFTFHRRMRGTVSQVADLMHDVHAWNRLHPLIIKVEQDPNNSQGYKMTERLSGPWHLWEYDNPIHAVFTPREDARGQGVNVSVTLSPSTVFPKYESQLRVKDTEEPGIVEVSEVVEIKALFLLIPYIARELTSSHKTIFERLAETIEKSNAEHNVVE